MALLLARDDYIHNQCQQSILALKNRFFASLIMFMNMRHHEGLTMISGAAMPL
jgi:hypothetical protein